MRKINIIDIFNPTKLRDWLNELLAQGGTPGPAGPAGPAGQKGDPVNAYALDVYNWTGTQDIAAGDSLNILTLPFTKNISGGSTSIADSVMKMVPVDGQTGIQFTIRITGNTGANTDAKEWMVQVVRVDENTIVSSVNAWRPSGVANINNRESFISSYTNGEDDPYSTDGLKLMIRNPGSGATIHLTSISLRVARIPGE